MQLHIRNLAFLPTQLSIPTLPSDADKASFNRREKKDNIPHVTASTMLDARVAAEEAGQVKDTETRIAEFRKDLVGVNGTHATNMRSMSDEALKIMFDGLWEAGFVKWNPGWTDHYTTTYNKDHIKVAVDTFVQIACSSGFNFMRLHPSALPAESRLKKMAIHYSFESLGQKLKDEQRSPGIVAHQQALLPLYQRRNRVRVSSFPLFHPLTF